MHLTVRLSAMFCGKLTSKVVLIAVTMLTIVFKKCSQLMVIIAKDFIKQQLSQTFILTHKTNLFIKTAVKTEQNELV